MYIYEVFQLYTFCILVLGPTSLGHYFTTFETKVLQYFYSRTFTQIIGQKSWKILSCILCTFYLIIVLLL